MNRIVEEFRRDDERILDKLVDGELTEADRKVLLSALDDEPGAWRRCALAFLEAQTWRGDFTQLLAGSALSSIEKAVGLKPGDSKPAPAPVAPASAAFHAGAVGQSGVSHAAASSFSPSRVLEYAMALAACLLVAFGLGIWARGAWQDTNGFAGQGAPQFAHGGSAFAPATTTVQSPGTWQGTTNSGLNGIPKFRAAILVRSN